MAASIMYNESVIANIDAGKKVTLKCNAQIMVDDIKISFTTKGVVRYINVDTIVDAGKTVTLRCAGKKMRSDVTIFVPSVFYQEFVVNDGSNFITADEEIFIVRED